MGEVVIVAYRPKPGREADLDALLADHVPYLRRLALATDRDPVLMRGVGDVRLEVFEWVDGGVALAHGRPEVNDLWSRFAEVCDYVPLNTLPEAAGLFATFKA